MLSDAISVHVTSLFGDKGIYTLGKARRSIIQRRFGGVYNTLVRFFTVEVPQAFQIYFEPLIL